MEKLIEHAHKLVKQVDNQFIRYIHDQINWKNRLIGITGPRGVGKTTMVLQHIKDSMNLSDKLYVTAEDFYFASNRLTDLADEFTKMGGKFLFIDEIHKYPGWAKELKLIYDYHPDLNVVFTGSSILDIKKGTADLSRRAVMYHMQGLSFREYLKLFHNLDLKKITLEDILNHKAEFSQMKYPLLLFKQYLKTGYYPFAKEDDFEQRMKQIVIHTLETDIPFYSGMNVSTGVKLKQLLAIIASSVPFKPNYQSIANAIGISRNNVADYIHFLEEAGMVSQLRDSTGGIKGLGKISKIYLDNTNLSYILGSDNSETGNLRETFFINQIRVNHNVISHKSADFEVEGYIFEIGGRNKKARQIKGTENGFIVKDDIEAGFLNICPLWQFGMLY